ncbi:MAG: hypothetical protein RLZZ232_1358 [Planctomycetota bacterium]|jgi:hypothetical protein
MRFVSGVTVRGHSRLFPVTGTDAWLEAGGWSPWGVIAAEFFAFSCSHAARVSAFCVPWGDYALPCRWPLMRRRDPLP